MGTGDVSLFLSVRGRRPRDTDQERSSPRLEPTLPKFISETKEESHGEEEEGQEENEVVLNFKARVSYWGSAGRIFRFRGVTDLAKRLNGVRPLLFWTATVRSNQV
jgi:hypothetical protein